MKSGLGIRSELFDAVFEHSPDLGFLEAHSENYFGDSLSRLKLLELRKNYDISLHGVGLSLGRADGLDKAHLQNLKQLVDELEPIQVSEHLSWSAYAHTHLPDLLPLPLTEQAFEVMCGHISEMQDYLGRQILLENPSNYLLFDQIQISETEFLNSLAQHTGCGLLVDVNNISVSSQNVKRDPYAYIDGLDSQYIQQYHLAGYTPVERNGERVLIDTHNQPIFSEVWELYAYTLQTHGKQATLIEWDSDFPEFDVLLSECEKANHVLREFGKLERKVWPYEVVSPNQQKSNHLAPNLKKQMAVDLKTQQKTFLQQILTQSTSVEHAVGAHKSRIWIYQNNVYGAAVDYLLALYPATAGVVGEEFFRQMARVFIKDSAPSKGDIHLYGVGFEVIINQFDALKELPYLSDLIKFEWAQHMVYYAENSFFDPPTLAQGELLSSPCHLNNSVQIIDSQFPIHEIHRQSLPEYSGNVSVNLKDSQDMLLIFKKEYSVIVRKLEAEEKIFFRKLKETLNLLALIDSLGLDLSPEQISVNLAFCFENNLLYVTKV